MAFVGIFALLFAAALWASGHHRGAVLVGVAFFLLTFVVDACRHAKAQEALQQASLAAAADAAPVAPIQEAIKLWHSPEKVWSLIAPAENSPLLNPEVERGYRVPGTPAGLGEQQASLSWDGKVRIAEVVEHAEDRKAVTKTVISTQPPLSVITTTCLDPVADGCILRIAFEYLLPADHRLPPDWVTEVRRSARDYLERVRSTLVTWPEPSTQVDAATPAAPDAEGDRAAN
jgi:hypothetical protein